ncbi:MAG: hypothetical protein ABEI27_11585 [Halobellus sp.]|uniref:hypothetical protein n=1 Tax=Halobellus sp. TaxID=1979212 RepID=UPI0035D4E612
MTDAHADEQFPPVSVDADLTLEVAGTKAEVQSTGERLFVLFPSLPGAVRAVRRLPEGGETRLEQLLELTDLTVEFRIRDRTVAVAGVGADPGTVSTQLGAAPIEIRIGGVLGAVGRELVIAFRSL